MTTTTKQRLLEKLNYLNGTNLTLNVVEFGIPEAHVTPLSKTNTKVMLTAKPGQSNLFGGREINYTRFDFSEFFSKFPLDRAFFLSTNVRTTHEMIPFLNEKFNLVIEPEDIVNIAIPLISQTEVTEFLFGATLDSFGFTGTYKFKIDPSEEYTPLPIGEVSILIAESGTADLKQAVKKLNKAGIVDSSFKFLSDVASVEKIDVQKIFRKRNGDLVLFGDFKLTLNSNATMSDAPALAVKPTGEYVEASFSNGIRLISEASPALIACDNNDNVYFKTSALNLNQAGLYKFNLNTLDIVPFSPDITYAPEFIYWTKNDKLLTVSAPYRAGNPYKDNLLDDMIRIDRLNNDGTFDETFSSIYISVDKNAVPVPGVVSIEEAREGKFFIFLNPGYGLSTKNFTPVVNGESLTNTEMAGFPTDFAWNPILRFNSDGRLDRTFKNIWPTRSGSQQAYFESVYRIGRRHLLSIDDEVTVFIYKANPITGYNHKQPVHFTRFGDEVLQSGVDYERQFKWSNFLGAEILSDGSVIAYGDIQIPNNFGIFGPRISVVVKYMRNGNIDRIIYKDNTLSISTKPVITAALIEQG